MKPARTLLYYSRKRIPKSFCTRAFPILFYVTGNQCCKYQVGWVLINEVMCKCHWIWKRDSKAVNGNSIESGLSRSPGRLQTHKHSLEGVFHQEERRASFERQYFAFKPMNSTLARYTLIHSKIQLLNQTVTQRLKLELRSLETQEETRFVYISLQIQIEEEGVLQCPEVLKSPTLRKNLNGLFDGDITACTISQSSLSIHRRISPWIKSEGTITSTCLKLHLFSGQ